MVILSELTYDDVKTIDDVSLNSDTLVKIFEEHGHEISIEFRGRKMWLHINENLEDDKVLLESEFSGPGKSIFTQIK